MSKTYEPAAERGVIANWVPYYHCETNRVSDPYHDPMCGLGFVDSVFPEAGLITRDRIFTASLCRSPSPHVIPQSPPGTSTGNDGNRTLTLQQTSHGIEQHLGGRLSRTLTARTAISRSEIWTVPRGSPRTSRSSLAA